MDIFALSTRGRRIAGITVAVALLASAACAPVVRRPSGVESPLRRVTALPELADDGARPELVAAVGQSLRYFERLPPDRVVQFGTTTRTAAQMHASFAALAAFLATSPTPDALTAELTRRFEVHQASSSGGVLFTGYYLPTLPARRTRDAEFRTPVLGRPPDLVTVALGDLGAPCACREQVVGRVVRGALAPYPTRAEIEAGAAGGAPALAWVADPVGLFFLQIQGSGVLTFPDRSERTIGFAASNGRPYVSIGKLLVDRRELPLERASMGGIREWIASHPTEGPRLLQENPRYVFFRELDGPPVGSLGVPVTPGRTIATDPSVFPPGALAFVHVPPTGDSRALARLVVNQDTGAAIRGPGRVDVYFGAGAEAESTAGRLRSPGELYFLAPR
jgi:membrane-bound lytic murein transglycosylase A